MIRTVGVTRIPSFSAQQLRAAREAKGWTRGRLAAALDMSTAAITGWERGQRTPEAPTFIKLAKAVDRKPHELLDVPRERWGMLEFRVVQGLQQQTVADQVGIPPERLGSFEAGHDRMDEDMTGVLAQIYKVSAEELAAAWQRVRDGLTNS